jgi:hypothetical protein
MFSFPTLINSLTIPTGSGRFSDSETKKPGDLKGRRAAVCSLLSGDDLKISELPEQPRLPQESHLTVAAHSSPHVQLQSVTDHLQFSGEDQPQRTDPRNLAQPS